MQNFSDGEATIAFASETLNPAQPKYGATELELFAVIFGVENSSHTCQEMCALK